MQEVVDSAVGNRESLKDSLTVAGVVDSVTVAFPLPGTGDRADVEIAAQLRAAGFVTGCNWMATWCASLLRASTPRPASGRRKVVLILVDRASASPANRGRLTDAVSTAFAEGDGVALIITDGGHTRRLLRASGLLQLRPPRPRAGTEPALASTIPAAPARSATDSAPCLNPEQITAR